MTLSRLVCGRRVDVYALWCRDTFKLDWCVRFLCADLPIASLIGTGLWNDRPPDGQLGIGSSITQYYPQDVDLGAGRTRNMIVFG